MNFQRYFPVPSSVKFVPQWKIENSVIRSILKLFWFFFKITSDFEKTKNYNIANMEVIKTVTSFYHFCECGPKFQTFWDLPKTSWYLGISSREAVKWKEWPSGLKRWSQNRKVPGSNSTTCSAGLMGPASDAASLQGPWWPSGRKCKATAINIKWVRLPPRLMAQSWPWGNHIAV